MIQKRESNQTTPQQKKRIIITELICEKHKKKSLVHASRLEKGLQSQEQSIFALISVA
jgi:hypothetical protein